MAMIAVLEKKRSPGRPRRVSIGTVTRPEGPIISTFLHQGRFAIVTNARFVPGPGNRVKTGNFSFDECWTGKGWGELIDLAMTFATRDEAQGFLNRNRELLRAGLQGRLVNA